MDSRAKSLLSQAATLDGQRSTWDSLWQELADVVHPRRGLITTKVASGSTPDRTKLAQAFDSTAARANRTLANGQFARITPMGARWFALRPPSESQSPEAMAWYARCGEILVSKLYASNFYSRAHEHYLDRGAFGTAATEVTGGKNGKGLHFRSFPVGSYSIAQNANDEVDVLYRTYNLTARQILDAFPETTPEEVRKKAANPTAQHEPIAILHAILPRQDRDPRKEDGKNKPFASFHIIKDGGHILLEAGYDEFPVAVSRWELWGDSPYGWSPAYLALPEATQANFLEQMLDTAVEVSVFPRVLYGASLKGDIDFRALGLTCYDPNQGEAPKEWLTAGRYDIGKDRVQDKRDAINEAFFVPLFNAIMQLDRKATATEVRAIVGESRELFHPIFAGLTREFLIPLLRRSFSILLRQGELPPPPASVIQKDDLGAFIADPGVEFVSSMALALEQSHLANFADCINVFAPLAQTDPGAMDFINVDVVGPAFFRWKGLPEDFIRPQDEIEAVRQSRQQMMQMQAAQQAAGAVNQLGGAAGIEQLSALAGQ